MSRLNSQHFLPVFLIAAVLVGSLALPVLQRQGSDGSVGDVAAAAVDSSVGYTPVASASSPAAPKFDPALDEQLATSEMTTVIVRLNTEFTGNDAQRTAAATAAVNGLLSTMPTGSFSDVQESGVLPVATFRASRAAVDVLRTSPLVRAVGADEPLELASEHARFRDGAATSNASGFKGDGTTVAVIDSGINSSHPYLMNGTTKKVIAEGCFTTAVPSQLFQSPCPGGSPMSITSPSVTGSGAACTYVDANFGCDHGTHVAGVVAGQPGTPGFGELSGVAPNTKLIALQVFGYKSDYKMVYSQSSDTLNALKWLYNRRADFPDLSAVNISIATQKTFPSSCDTDTAGQQPAAGQQAMFLAVQALRDVGIVTIASAGNSGINDGITSPGCLSNVVGVGAIDDATGARAPFSNISNSVSLFAPGAGILSAYPNIRDTPKSESGTSQAAPAVAGAWALLRQKYPKTVATPKSVTDILTILKTTGTEISTTVALATGPVTYKAPAININRALGIPSPTSIAIGSNFSCARNDDTTVSCSGANTAGQLGVSPTVAGSLTKPKAIPGLTGVTSVVAGDTFACAQISLAVSCWGDNSSGQLGTGKKATTASSGPAKVKANVKADLTSVSSISAGGKSACAVVNAGAAGTVSCWGDNASGQLGDNTLIAHSYPAPVKATAAANAPNLSGVKSVSMGTSSACVVLNTGAVSCWGANVDGALGNNSTTASKFPVPVTDINGIKFKAIAVSVGNGFACALGTSAGATTSSVMCWGRNANGQLGNNKNTRSLVPVAVVTNTAAATSSTAISTTTFTGVVAISSGTDHTCALATVSGVTKLFCWGLNTSRQLGVGTSDRYFAAAAFSAAPSAKSDGATSVAVGPGNTAVVIRNVSAVVGVNIAGQLGLGDTVNRTDMTWSLTF
jgi:alpha-tubulin suppressor-like RCC1 family protein